MIKFARKTIAALLPCVAIAMFIVLGCADKKKNETKAAALEERATVTTTATEADSQTIDGENTTPAYINGKHAGLKCKKNADGRLECIDADNYRLLAKGAWGKDRDTWYRFFVGDNDSCLEIAGFKDKNGVTRFDVNDWLKNGVTRIGVYNLLFHTDKFDDIIIAHGYYLTKTGKKVGKDSVTYDLSPECCHNLNCESEGFIVFWDEKHDREGMFNCNGDVVIPAEYNVLKRVQNGMIVARKDAVRKRVADRKVKIDSTGNYEIISTFEDCGGDGEYEMCFWQGGKWLLIDTLNNILIEDLGMEYPDVNNLNLFSVKKTEKTHPDTAIRRSFPAKAGGYYSFISHEKELMYWLKRDLLKNLTVEKLITATYDSIRYESSFDRLSKIIGNKRSFVTANFASLKKALMDILNPELKIDIPSVEFEISFDGVYDEFRLKPEYYDNCGNHKYWIYPAMKIKIEYKDYKRNEFTFLRTDNGYKLVEVMIKNDDNFKPQTAD